MKTNTYKLIIRFLIVVMNVLALIMHVHNNAGIGWYLLSVFNIVFYSALFYASVQEKLEEKHSETLK